MTVIPGRCFYTGGKVRFPISLAEDFVKSAHSKMGAAED